MGKSNIFNLESPSSEKVPPKCDRWVTSKKRTFMDFDLNDLKLFLSEVPYVLQNILKCAGGILIY